MARSVTLRITVNSWRRRARHASLLLIIALLLSCSGKPEKTPDPAQRDWPTWRRDAARSAVSPETLPASLHLQWTLRLSPTSPAWPDQPRLRFDVAYEPVVAEGRMFI